MRIGVDARELLGDATGVGRYLGELLRRWASRPDASARRFLLYAPEPLPLALPPGATELRITGRGRGTWWEQTYLRSAIHGDRPDVFFAPAYTAPLGTEVPLAVTIHDISFVAHPEWFRAGEGARRRWLTRRAAHKASIIFTDSEFSKREIESYLRVDPSRLRVIPPGVTPRASSSANNERDPLVLLRRVDLQPPAHSRSDCRLRSGDARYARTRVRRSSATIGPGPNRICRTSPISTALRGEPSSCATCPTRCWPACIGARECSCSCPSTRDSVSTPLEALAAGVPVVLLDTPVAREVYGDAAVFVRRDDSGAAAAAMRRFLTEPASAQPLLARAGDVLARYSWQHAADLTLAARSRGSRADDPLDRHRQLQRPRRSRELSGIAAGCSASDRARRDRRGQCVGRRERGHREARWPAVKVIDARSKRRIRRRQQRRHPATSGDLVLLLNNDTLVPRGAIDGLVQRLLAHPDRGRRGSTAAGRARPDRDFVRADDLAARRSFDRSALGGSTTAAFGPVKVVSRTAATERYVDWVSGACLLVRRADAEAVGLLDERYFPLHGGCRFLRIDPRARPSRAVRAGRPDHAPARAFA